MTRKSFKMSYKFFFFACALNLFYYVPNLLASPIIGGHPDYFNTYNYQVSIYYNHDHGNANSEKLLCGGAIIDDTYVLTAAHCFMTKINRNIEETLQPTISGLVVLAGSSKTYGSGIIADVRKVFIPHVFDMQEKYGDIAVVQLAVNLNIVQNRDRLQSLPLDPGYPFQFYENNNALVAGNGCDAFHRGDDGVFRPLSNRVAERRQVLKVHMLTRKQCPADFDHSICAVNLDRSQIRACTTGDSGSPLVYRNTIIGVLSQIPLVFQNMNGMVFTRVWKFTDFIRNAMNERDNHSQMHVLDQ